MRFIPKHETFQKYGAILLDTLTNQAMKESDAYKTYHDFATGKVIPKPKYVRRSTREKIDQAPTASPGKILKATAKVAKSGKKKLPTQGLKTLSEIALSEAEQMKIVTKRSKTQFHSYHANGSGENEGTGVSLGVPDVPTYGSEDEQISWKSSDEDDDDEVSLSKDDDDNTNNEDDDGNMMIMNRLNQIKMVMTLDVNVNLERRDTEMTDALQTNVQGTQVIEDTHVIITVVTPEVQQQSSFVSSGFISNMLNPNLDTCIDSILNLNTESTSLVYVPVTTNVKMPPLSVTTPFPPPIPLIQTLQQTPVPIPIIIPSSSQQNLPTFGSLFKFEDRVKSLEDDFSEFKQINLFAEAVSLILDIVDKYLANQMNEAVKAAKIIKEQVKIQVKEQVTKILLKIEKSVNEQLEAEVLIRSSNEAKTPHNLYKALVDAYEFNKDILAIYGDTVTLKRRRDDEDDDEEPSAGSNQGSKRRRAEKEPESTSAPKEKTSKPTGKSKEGSESHQKSTGQSAQAEEPIHTVEDLEEPAHQEFDTGFDEDQPVDETT
ncbi:hypothetical protein Tco_1467213 [Tanacetum coccineum]